MWLKILFITLLAFGNSTNYWEGWRQDTSSVGLLATNHRDWGNLREALHAPAGYYGCGGRYRLEPSQGEGDDTAMNGIDVRFCKLSDWNTQVDRRYDGFWGDWSEWKMCPKGSFIYGIKARV